MDRRSLGKFPLGSVSSWNTSQTLLGNSDHCVISCISGRKATCFLLLVAHWLAVPFPTCPPDQLLLCPLLLCMPWRSSCLYTVCPLGCFHAPFLAAWTKEVKDKITQEHDVLTGLVLTGERRKTLGGPSNSQYMIIFIGTILPWQSRKPTVVGMCPASMSYQCCL